MLPSGLAFEEIPVVNCKQSSSTAPVLYPAAFPNGSELSISVSYCPEANSLCPVWFAVEKEVLQTWLCTSSECHRGVICLYSCPSQAVADIYTGEMKQYLCSRLSVVLKSSVISGCSYFYWLYIVCVSFTQIESVELWLSFVLPSTFQVGCLEESQSMLKIC